MSIRSLCDRLGQDVTIQRASQSLDQVHSAKTSFTDDEVRRAYVSDNGTEFGYELDAPQGSRSVGIYFADVVDISVDDRILIGGEVYVVGNVRNPGLRSSGPLAYQIVTATRETKL